MSVFDSSLVQDNSILKRLYIYLMQKWSSLLLLVFVITCSSFRNISNSQYVGIILNPQTDSLRLYNLDTDGDPLRNFNRLINHITKQGDSLLFGMNAGMYSMTGYPIGLYIENYKVQHEVDRRSNSEGNFYWLPNGIFLVNKKGTASIVKTTSYKSNKDIRWATQSGPMMIIDGKIRSDFSPKSDKRNIRNGVGVLKNGEVVLLMSKYPLTFYEFAQFFKKLGCKQALYLDGAISQVYYPGVIRANNMIPLGPFIGVVAKKRGK